ncbi:MAG: hypothetical protein LBU11_07735 [Zoogloeaceae bacterium]|jgi:cation/acetate symporter|nr:hypothetical protein [Zoogloeaceae bacterium]
MRRVKPLKALGALGGGLALFVLGSGPVRAQAAAEIVRHPASPVVIAAFFVVAFIVLIGACWATERAQAFLYAHTEISDPQGRWHGLSLCGAHLSAAALLGLPALMLTQRDTAFLWIAGLLAGWPFLALLFSERLHNLGMLTFADALVWRSQSRALRVLAAVSTLLLTLLYLTAQIIGAGQIFGALFGLEYWLAALMTGSLMMVIALRCGRLALTWLVIVKTIALLLLFALLAALVLWTFGFSAEETSGARPFLAAASANFLAAQTPLDRWSLGWTLVLGLMGLPHLLMRFTAASARSAHIARQGGLWAGACVGVFFALLLIAGLGVAHLPIDADVMGHLALRDNNALTLLYLAESAGGGAFMGAAAAVVLIALLAVAVSLGHATAAAAAHDLYASVLRGGRIGEARERKSAHLGVTLLFVSAMLLSMACAGQSVLFPVALALAIAASVHTPMLLLSLFWKGCTRRGAFMGGVCGLLSALTLTIFSPPVWVTLLGHAVAPFSYALPTLFSVSFALLATWVFSLADRSARARQERADWPRQQARAETGI